jgi:hypothetical protein
VSAVTNITTPSQDARIQQISDEEGVEGQFVSVDPGENGIVTLRIHDKAWTITPRGKATELETSGTARSEDAEGQGGAMDAHQEDPGESHLPVPTAPPALPLVEGDLYQALSAADERQIMAELEGRAVKTMVYSFRQDGKPATGLSWVGVQEAVRQMNTRNMGRIAVTDFEPTFETVVIDVDTGKTDEDGQPITEPREAVRVRVYARDEVYGTARWGTATQLRSFKLKDKRDKKGRPIWKPDQFADAKALSKAQRNAMEGMLPLELVEELKALYLGQGRVEYIEASAIDVTDLPPPLTDDRAKKLTDEIRELYDRLKRDAGLKVLPPAEFHRYMAAAEHSHDRLEDFKAFLIQRVEEAQKQEAAA